MKKFDNRGINLETYNLLTRTNMLPNNEVGSLKNLFILETLSEFTKDNNRANMLNKKIINNDIGELIIKFDNDKNTYVCILDDDEQFSFELADETVKDLPDFFKTELITDERDRKCHTYSFIYCLHTGCGSILTGFVKWGKKQILHSVVLVMDENNKEKIIDFTFNIVVDINDYIKLFEFDLINTVDAENIITDGELLKEYGIYNISLKFYLTYRDEIINSINKIDNVLKKGG